MSDTMTSSSLPHPIPLLGRALEKRRVSPESGAQPKRKGKARSQSGSFLTRRPILLALAVSAVILALTADERTFGLTTDGQIVSRTAYSIAELGELGIARGHKVNIVRPEGDAVTRYGIGASLVQVPAALLAGSFEEANGPGSSQTLFVLGQLFWVLAAAGAAGVMAQSLGGSGASAGLAILVASLSSPLWGYVSSDFSEPLQAAAVGWAFAFGFLAAGADDEKRQRAFCIAAGAAAGAALLAKSIFIVLLPFVLAISVGSSRSGRLRRALFTVSGWIPLSASWLALEVVRFGRPFASYEGEHFSHPLFDGLWRLLVGSNKGLVFYFPLALLVPAGLVLLFRKSRTQASWVLGFCGFVLASTAAWWSWDGAAGWGPRLLVPLVPLLAALAVTGAGLLKPVFFWILFSLGLSINFLGALQPDALTTWYYSILAPKPLSKAEAGRYPNFALEKKANGDDALLPLHHVHANSAFSPIRVSWFLLGKRLLARNPVEAISRPPWATTVPGQEVALSPARAIPESALVFFRAGFRWPHLGMSLSPPAGENDTALTYIDCLYDQALRAQDMRRADRAVRFAFELYRRVPGPQSAVAYMEGLRLEGSHDELAAFAKDLPPEWTASSELGMVLALSARDRGENEKAGKYLTRITSSDPRPAFKKLSGRPPTEWPPTLREILR